MKAPKSWFGPVAAARAVRAAVARQAARANHRIDDLSMNNLLKRAPR
jgi:hypothetical protein